VNTVEKRKLTEKEEKEIRKIIDETTSIYDFMQKNDLYEQWMGDSERFMGFTFVHTKNLVKHSITLSKLTRWLIGLTITLVILSAIHIFLVLSDIFEWF
jgi:hypothetical protein